MLLENTIDDVGFSVVDEITVTTGTVTVVVDEMVIGVEVAEVVDVEVGEDVGINILIVRNMAIKPITIKTNATSTLFQKSDI